MYRHVERLLACQLDGSAAPLETSRWIASLSDTMRKRLVKAGLVEPLVERTIPTLGELVEQFKERPGWIRNKDSTKRNYTKGFRHLLAYFEEGQPIDGLTEAKAEDFRAHLLLAKDKGGASLSVAYANSICGMAWTLYRFAIRSQHLACNPFEDVQRGKPKTDSNVFVADPVARDVMAELPNTQWKLLFALSRWGGLRIPSEPRRLRWCDIDWANNRFRVHCSKTEHHVGHETRWVPIFPELAELFDKRFSEATEGDELVLPMMEGRADGTFWSGVSTAVERAGHEVWPRLFHSMRSTRQTELVNAGISVQKVCAWIGNSREIYLKHYGQVTPSDYQEMAHFCAQHVPAQSETEQKPPSDDQSDSTSITSDSVSCS